MNQKRIVIDGKVYNNVDEMPPDIRRQYEEAMRNFDKNQNGIPDLFETMNPFGDQNRDGTPDAFENLGTVQNSAGNVMSSTKIIVNGQTYDNLDQLPPDMRAKYQQAIGSMDANGNGIPDFVEGMLNVSNQTTVKTAIRTETSTPLRSTPIPAPASIEPESTGNWIWVLAGIIFAGACLVIAAVGVWYFYLR